MSDLEPTTPPPPVFGAASPEVAAAVPVAAAPVEPALPDLSMLDDVAAELDAVERALARLDEGTYGTCEACGAAVADDVLAVQPALARCAEHAA